MNGRIDMALDTVAFGYEGVTAIDLAAEGQGMHEIADAEHPDVGDHIVIRHATTDERQRATLSAVRTSLGMWWQFFDGMDEAFG